MQTGNEPYLIEDQGWVVKVQPPKQPERPRVLLLLHGWTGDESVMWIFTRNLPANTWLFAPRGQVISPEGGYGWLEHELAAGWPTLDQFAGPAAALINAFHAWKAEAGAPQDPFDVMGFSQGAAMAYALGAIYPQQVSRVIALAGFMPRETGESAKYAAYKGKKVYMAHGTADKTVPVRCAQDAVQTLQQHGAQVTYCESEVGHKLSAACLRGLETFLR